MAEHRRTYQTNVYSLLVTIQGVVSDMKAFGDVPDHWQIGDSAYRLMAAKYAWHEDQSDREELWGIRLSRERLEHEDTFRLILTGERGSTAVITIDDRA